MSADTEKLGIKHALKIGFSNYMSDFYAQLYPETNALDEFTGRGKDNAIMWTPARMVDRVEEMLEAYRRNQNSNTPNAGSKFPIILMAMAKNYTPTHGGMGGRQFPRQLIRFEPGLDASVYGYRQAMGDFRMQLVFISAEEPTTSAMAVQFAHWIGHIVRRSFFSPYTWGQYTMNIPAQIEDPDVEFEEVEVEQQNISILTCKLVIRSLIPYFDAPLVGAPNDGTTNNPPGYPVVKRINVKDQNSDRVTQVLAESEMPPLYFDGTVNYDGSQIYDGIHH